MKRTKAMEEKTAAYSFAICLVIIAACGLWGIVADAQQPIPDEVVTSVADHVAVLEPDGTNRNSWVDMAVEIEPNATTAVVIRPKRNQVWEKVLNVVKIDPGPSRLFPDYEYGAFDVSEPVLLPDQSGWYFVVDTREPKELPPYLQPETHLVSVHQRYQNVSRGRLETRSKSWGFRFYTPRPLVLPE